MSYASQLRIFQGGVMSRDRKAAEALIKKSRHNEFTPAMRLAVYADGYTVRLEEASAADYPALKHHMGEEAFDKAIVAFVQATPSRRWDLNIYAIPFAAFIQGYIDDPFAHVLAKLEACITDVFWMPESEPLPADYFAGKPEAAFAEAVLLPRKASYLLGFDYPVNNYLVAYRNDEKPSAPAPEKQYIYMVRNDNKVMREVLIEPAYLLLQQLFAGKSVGKSLEEVTNARADLAETIGANLGAWFQEWFEKGFFAAI